MRLMLCNVPHSGEATDDVADYQLMQMMALLTVGLKNMTMQNLQTSVWA